ncbi:leucine-rich repeat domain-containing protein [Flavivirga eckloniae]|nr:leucine-rich repeat domain-containing protein [Flavivirga eckloniae]
MKKQLQLKWSFAILFIVLTATTYGQNNIGDTFTVDDLRYKITSLSPNTVKVMGYDGTPPAVLIIPSQVNGYTVTSIGVNAFKKEAADTTGKLETITIPPSVTSIESSAFAHNKLTSIKIPNVTSIGNHAFIGNQLTSVTLSEGMVTISDSAFKQNQLTSIEIPNSMQTIGNSAFGVNKLTSVTIPENVKKIEDWAFANNPYGSDWVTTHPSARDKLGLVTVFIEAANLPTTPPQTMSPPKVKSDIFTTTLGQYVDSLRQPLPPVPRHGIIDLIVPEGKAFAYRSWYRGNFFKTIREAVFTNGGFKYEITKINPNGVGEVKIIDYSATATDVTIPATVSNRASYEYDANSTIYSNGTTEYEYKVTSIGPGTFSGKDLSSVDIPEGVTSIGERAFSDNDLSIVHIPKNVKTIGKEAFQNNTNLAIVVVERSGDPPFIEDGDRDPFKNKNRGAINLIVPKGTVATYTATGSGWKDFNSTRETREKGETIDDINEDFDYEVTSLNPYEVSISKYEGTATDLGRLPDTKQVDGVIHYKVTAIGENVFIKPEARDPNVVVNRLTNVVIPEGVTSIGAQAFMFNDLTEITIPNSVTSIGSAAFQGNQLESVMISNSLITEHIGANIFSENNFTQVTISEEMTIITNGMFRENHLLTSVVIPDKVTIIGNGAFAQNLALEEVTISKEIKSIGAWAFSDTPLKTVEIKAESPPVIRDMGFPLLPSDFDIYGTVFTGRPNSGFADRRGEIDLIVPESAEQDYRDDDFWSGFKSINGDVTMSLNNTNELRDFTVYPNPAQDKIHIRLSEGQALQQVNIYNMLGAHLYTTHTSPLDVSHLSGGMYILEVTTKTGAKAVKRISIK